MRGLTIDRVIPVISLAPIAGATSAKREGLGRAALAIAAIAATALAGFFTIRLSGGSPSPLNHLGYVPILLAAFLYGLRGSLPAAMLVAVLFGPTAAWLGLPGGLEGPDAWLTRSVFFVGIGAITGVLFDQLHRNIEGWRTAALTIAQRERDGMVALARGAEARDTDTGDHIQRVHSLAEALAHTSITPS